MKNSITLVILALIIHTDIANALVSAGSEAGTSQWNIELKSVLERGKIEPNENRASFQSAQIDIFQVGIAKSLADINFGSEHFVRLDFKYLKSGKEEVAGQTFYESDSGQAATINYGFNFVKEASYSSGVSIAVTPFSNFNKDKFSVPRIDLWSLSFRTSVDLNKIFYIEDFLHYGSGIAGKQNSYLAFSHLFALKLNSLIHVPATLKFGPYTELDTSERTDAKYDAAFSSTGSTDRIRSMKVGIISSLEYTFSADRYASVTYVQKLGGYDATATNALSAMFGFNF